MRMAMGESETIASIVLDDRKRAPRDAGTTLGTAQDGLHLIACTIGRDTRVGDERVLGASGRLGHAPGHGRAGLDAWAFILTRDR